MDEQDDEHDRYAATATRCTQVGAMAHRTTAPYVDRTNHRSPGASRPLGYDSSR